MASENYRAPSVAQSAELAEQQGLELPPLPASSAHDPHTGEPLFSESKMRMFANAALAATGKQQVGEVMRSDLSGYAMAASQVRRGYDVACDRCGKFCDAGFGPCQQAGEVQGGARAQFEAWAKSKNYSVEYGPDCYVELSTQRTWTGFLAGLAARQPGAHQQPSFGEVREIRIPARNKLDPISVFVQDQAEGRGRIVVTCYGNAWQGFWGAMGDRTVMEFVAKCDPDYVAGSMLQGRQTRIAKHERDYATRIAAEVITEFRTLIDQRDAAPGVGS